MPSSPLTIYTIGHGRHAFDYFLGLLRQQARVGWSNDLEQTISKMEEEMRMLRQRLESDAASSAPPLPIWLFLPAITTRWWLQTRWASGIPQTEGSPGPG